MVAAVRDARHEEAGAIADLLSRAAFGPTVSRLVRGKATSRETVGPNAARESRSAMAPASS